MKVPYQYITFKQIGELSEQGYECSCDGDEQAVRLVRRWPKDTLKIDA